MKAVRIELESTSQIAKFDRLLGDDGKWYKNKREEMQPRLPHVRNIEMSAAEPENPVFAPAISEKPASETHDICA